MTFFAGVPTMYWAMLNHRNATGSCRARSAIPWALRLGRRGDAVELMRQVEETFGVAILEGYGLSETSPVATSNRRDERKTGRSARHLVARASAC